MKKTFNTLFLSGLLVYLVGCATSDQASITPSPYTGNEITYPLSSGSAYNISGTATLKERTDHATDVIIVLTGTDGTEAKFPVHLHLGDISLDKTEIAALLAPVDNKTGKSTTTLKQLADETAVTYTQLKSLSASIKIHLSDVGDGRTVILAAGNIGSALTNNSSSGRISIGVCKSN